MENILRHLKELENFFNQCKELGIELPNGISGRNEEMIFQLTNDVGDDPVYKFIASFNDIIDYSPEHVQKFFRELPLDKQVEFINKNDHSTKKGFEWGLGDPIHDVMTTIGGGLQCDDDIILERLSEPLGVKSKGGIIKVTMDIDVYYVSYENDKGLYLEEEFDNEDDADVEFARLKKKHPECVVTTKLD